jgi:hypothetical protein
MECGMAIEEVAAALLDDKLQEGPERGARGQEQAFGRLQKPAKRAASESRRSKAKDPLYVPLPSDAAERLFSAAARSSLEPGILARLTLERAGVRMLEQARQSLQELAQQRLVDLENEQCKRQ